MSTPNRKRPSGPPASVGVLAKYTQAYARSRGVAEGRVRGWVAHMALAGALERSVQVAKDNGLNGYLFTIKGGVALELRLRERARATKDIDLVLHDSVAELAVALERAIASGYQGFQFQRRREPVVLDNGTVSVQLAATYEGGAWTTVSVDIARAEPGEAEAETPWNDPAAAGGQEKRAVQGSDRPDAGCRSIGGRATPSWLSISNFL